MERQKTRIWTTLLKMKNKVEETDLSLVVQWLRLCAPTSGDMGLTPGWGTEILHAVQCDQKKNNIKNKVGEVTVPLEQSLCLTLRLSL